MKKITKLTALILALALVLSLTACSGKTTIVGNWKYTMDFKKLMEASGELGGEGAEGLEEMTKAMADLFDGVSMVITLNLKEDNTFEMGTDEASLKAAGEKIKERIPDLLKAMFGGEEGLNQMLELSGQSMDEMIASAAEEFSPEDMKMDPIKGKYTYEEGKLVLTPDGEDAMTMTVELAAKELKVTAIEGEADDDGMGEAFKAMLPMIFVK